MLNLNQYPKSGLLEILKQQHKKSYIKNLHGSTTIDAFIMTMPLIKDTDGQFIQRAELIYKVLDGGKYEPVYILSPHEEILDLKGYADFFGFANFNSTVI